MTPAPEDEGGERRLPPLPFPTAHTAATTRSVPGCALCRLAILDGHGHLRRDGTITREATIRWV